MNRFPNSSSNETLNRHTRGNSKPTMNTQRRHPTATTTASSTVISHRNPTLMAENAAILASKLLKTEDRFDFESEEGVEAAQGFLKHLERMCECMKVRTLSRAYREEFTQSYQVLYQPNKLCYLTEIIDSAQEGIPHLWVNGEKYKFSSEVLAAGVALYEAFKNLVQKIHQKSFREKAKLFLKIFDKKWAEYEHMYVLQLMVIEYDARRFIRKAGLLQKQLSEIQKKSKKPEKYLEKRRLLVKIIGKINSVSNTEGRGRDDLSLDILLAAQNLSRRFTSRQIQLIASNVKKSFSSLRSLFRTYFKNIEQLDPQLRNNQDLVEALVKFENAWQKGKSFLLNVSRRNQLIYFSKFLKSLSTRHPHIREQIECCESELLLALPSLIVLHKLQSKDFGLCRYLCPEIDIVGSKVYSAFVDLASQCEKRGGLEGLESSILNGEDGEAPLSLIRNIAMEVQRCKPTQWSRFLDVALSAS